VNARRRRRRRRREEEGGGGGSVSHGREVVAIGES